MSTPKNLISLAEFLEMKESFNSSIKIKLGTQETRSVWFSFENLKEYFAYVEKEATSNGITVSGIRFHMVAQTKDKKQLTLALTPTYEDNSKHIDFDPIYSSKEKPAALKSLEGDTQKSGGTGGILNKGDICPVMCP
jgi:hypothetical protein